MRTSKMIVSSLVLMIALLGTACSDSFVGPTEPQAQLQQRGNDPVFGLGECPPGDILVQGECRPKPTVVEPDPR